MIVDMIVGYDEQIAQSTGGDPILITPTNPPIHNTNTNTWTVHRVGFSSPQ
jgi:hypothetical protein